MTDTLAEKLRQITADDNDEADILFEAADRLEALEKALRTLIKSCDAGVMMSRVGVGGMTVSTNIKSSWVNNVEAWAVEEARAALEGKDGQKV